MLQGNEVLGPEWSWEHPSGKLWCLLHNLYLVSSTRQRQPTPSITLLEVRSSTVKSNVYLAVVLGRPCPAR
jgi:hypothetical protein